MVKSPDYVYRILPDSGEYGFEQQPSTTDGPVLSRVQSLAGSFQWIGKDTSNPIAIAVDRGSPNLIARITTDPGDPDGRLSLQMHIWQCDSDHELAELVAVNWPDEQSLPLNRHEFMKAFTGQPKGRYIVGPAGQFIAVDFDQSWDGHTGKPDPALSRRRNAASRNVKQARVHSKSSLLPNLITFVMTVVAILSSGFAYKFHSAMEKGETAAKQAERDLQGIKTEAGGLRDELANKEEKLREEREQHHRELRKKELFNDELLKGRAKHVKEMEERKDEVEKLRVIVARDPKFIDQKELDDLRRLKTAVGRYIADTSSAREQLKKALNSKPGFLENLKNGISDNSEANAP